MPRVVAENATLTCTFGLAPSTLGVTMSSATSGPMKLATVMDNVPMVNIKPFGNCTSMSYPATAAATAAALGALTPMPCVPAVSAPWSPGSSCTKIDNMPALLDNSRAMCSFGGQISVSVPGQFVVESS